MQCHIVSIDIVDSGRENSPNRKLVRSAFFSQIICFPPVAGRWRQMVANDVILQKCIARARTLEQLIEISQKPEYRSMFSTEKWNLIAQCVIDDATVNNGSGTAASSRVTMAGNDRHRLMMTESPSSSSGGSIHRFAKKDDAPRRALVVATATAKKKGQSRHPRGKMSLARVPFVYRNPDRSKFLLLTTMVFSILFYSSFM
jgi:hypothetical protein